MYPQQSTVMVARWWAVHILDNIRYMKQPQEITSNLKIYKFRVPHMAPSSDKLLPGMNN